MVCWRTTDEPKYHDDSECSFSRAHGRQRTNRSLQDVYFASVERGVNVDEDLGSVFPFDDVREWSAGADVDGVVFDEVPVGYGVSDRVVGHHLRLACLVRIQARMVSAILPMGPVCVYTQGWLAGHRLRCFTGVPVSRG